MAEKAWAASPMEKPSARGAGYEVVDSVADLGDVGGIDTTVTAERYISFSDEECAIVDQDERVALLIRRAAHALMAIHLPFGERQVTTLAELAGGSRS